ncbi:hypothetical protein ACQ4PT_002963 [Festuca glaucescens]
MVARYQNVVCYNYDIPSINLKEGSDLERVTVKIMGWEGDMPDIGVLQECWVQIRGIPPKWVSWKVIAQVSKTLGLLLDVDWAGIFRSFYEIVRVKLAVKNVLEIPEERGYVMKKKTYWLIFTVEGDNEIEGPDDMDNDDGNDGHDEDPGEEEGFDGLEDVNEQLDEKQTPDKSGAQSNLPPSPADKKRGAQSWAGGYKNKTCYNSFQPLLDYELIDEEEVDEEIEIDVDDVTERVQSVAFS